MLTESAMDEIVVLESLYCIGGEFQQLSEGVLKIKFADNCFITFDIDQDYPLSSPGISVTLNLFGRKQNDDFQKDLLAFSLNCLDSHEQKMISIIEHAKERYNDMKLDEVKEHLVQDVEIELIIVRIDHMRRSGPYVRTLESWSQQMGLVAILMISNDQGLVLIIEGEKGQITKFLLQWKTTNIDVDSKGKPCKEKMIQILYREKQKTSGALKDICSCDFQVKECDNLLEYFSGKQLEEIIKSIFV